MLRLISLEIIPPLMEMTWPVMYAASSEARKATSSPLLGVRRAHGHDLGDGGSIEGGIAHAVRDDAGADRV